MPKKDIDWSKNVIYKICCKDLEIKDIYVGHTTNLVKRRYAHKADCNKENRKNYNYKVYQFIRANGGWDNWDVIEVDKCPCLDYEEASKIERYYIETLNATLNKVIPSRTKKEYYNDNIDFYKQKFKEYREANKELLYKNASEKIECECGSFIRRGDLLRHKKSQKHIKLMETKV